jgi:hypothetical protein
MQTVIIHTEGDGVAVIIGAPGIPNETLVQAVPVAANYITADISELPEDRYFRDAWRLVDGQLVVDIEAAKEVQRDEWRRLRKPKLDALDLDFMRALEAGESLVAIAAAKTALRDVTETELSGTLEEIKANIPAILL